MMVPLAAYYSGLFGLRDILSMLDPPWPTDSFDMFCGAQMRGTTWRAEDINREETTKLKR